MVTGRMKNTTGLSVHVLHTYRRYRQKHRNSGCVNVQGKVGQCPGGHQDPLLSWHLNSDSRARWAEYLGAAQEDCRVADRL